MWDEECTHTYCLSCLISRIGWKLSWPARKFRYIRWVLAGKPTREPSFLEAIWSSDTQDAIDFTLILSSLVKTPPDTEVGSVIKIPKL